MIRNLLLIAALLAIDVIWFGAIATLVFFPGGDMETKLTALVLSHWFLACFWLSFGGMRAPWRQAISTGILILVCAFTAPLDSIPNMAFVRSLLILAMTWLFYAVMFFPKRLGGLQISFEEADSRSLKKKQFSLGLLLAFTLVAATPFGLFRLAMAVDAAMAKELLYDMTLIFIPLCLTVAPYSIAVFATHRPLLKISLSLGWCLLTTFGFKHFAPPTNGGPVNWEAVSDIHALIWSIVGVNLFAARALGLRWAGGKRELAAQALLPSKGILRRSADHLQWLFGAGLLLAFAILCGWAILFTPLMFQFVAIYVLVATAPAVLVGWFCWRRAWPSTFWASCFLVGALPWAAAMISGSREVVALLWGTPAYAKASTVEVIPICGRDWSEMVLIMASPLIAGALGGVLALSIPPIYSWTRRKLTPPQAARTA
jgi:hypothetical protein